MPFTVRFLGFSFDISELESYLTNKFNHLEENVMTALTETKQGLATIFASLDTLFETIASESQQIQDKIDSLSLTLSRLENGRFLSHRLLSSHSKSDPDRTPPQAVSITGCPTAINPRFLIT
jgi:uncharacterized membrane-anchored protein YhcB (DUF1043 family)